MKTTRKLTALLMALVLCLSFVSFAFAEDALSLNWDDDTLAALQLLGQSTDRYLIKDIDVLIWMPDGITPQDLTQEDVDSGMIAFFTNQEGSCGITVVKKDIGMTLEEYVAALAADSDVSELQDVYLNGYNFVGYSLEAKDCACLAAQTESGKIVEFTFYPASDEFFSTVLVFIMASIQSADAVQAAA